MSERAIVWDTAKRSDPVSALIAAVRDGLDTAINPVVRLVTDDGGATWKVDSYPTKDADNIEAKDGAEKKEVDDTGAVTDRGAR